MATGRTTIVLGERERRAAKKLAAHWGVTPSEAIRRALLKVESQELEVGRNRRIKERAAAFLQLITLFKGHDPRDELARIRDDRDST